MDCGHLNAVTFVDFVPMSVTMELLNDSFRLSGTISDCSGDGSP